MDEWLICLINRIKHRCLEIGTSIVAMIAVGPTRAATAMAVTILVQISRQRCIIG